jgi:hypothetical protein
MFSFCFALQNLKLKRDFSALKFSLLPQRRQYYGCQEFGTFGLNAGFCDLMLDSYQSN